MKRDISPYDVTRLLVEAEKVRGSIDNLNQTIAMSSSDIVSNINSTAQQVLSFIGDDTIDQILDYLQKIYEIVPKVVSLVNEIEHTLTKSNVAIFALIFFGIGATLFFIMLLLYTEYRICRKRHARRPTFVEIPSVDNAL